MEKKYIPLAEFFQNATSNEITLTFSALETIMGQSLPNSAYLNVSWWKKNKSPFTHYFAWKNAGYTVAHIKLGQSITFSKIGQQNHSLDENTNKMAVLIRPIQNDDIRALIDLKQLIFEETSFEYETGKSYDMTVQQYKKKLQEQKNTKNSTTFLCIADGLHVGYIEIIGHNTLKQLHVATIRLGVISTFQQKGIGTALIDHALSWASDNKLKRIEAHAVVDNTVIIHLLKKFMFKNEGTRKSSVAIAGSYHDELYFSKLLD